MNTKSVVETFTEKSVDRIKRMGGSSSWVMSLNTASKLAYCVCVRNDEQSDEPDDGKRDEARHEAFLVGKVASVDFVEEKKGRKRYMIRFSEYAEVSVPGFRHGMTRNPVVYSDVEHCRTRGLDIAKLDFKPMPPVTPAPKAQDAVSPKAGLSIAQAKEGLSIYFDVPEGAITITISG